MADAAGGAAAAIVPVVIADVVVRGARTRLPAKASVGAPVEVSSDVVIAPALLIAVASGVAGGDQVDGTRTVGTCAAIEGAEFGSEDGAESAVVVAAAVVA